MAKSNNGARLAAEEEFARKVGRDRRISDCRDSLIQAAERYEKRWNSLGKGMVKSLNKGQQPRLMAIGPVVAGGGLKSLYGKSFGHSGLPGKVFEVTCGMDGGLDLEGLGSVYYGIKHLGIRRLEAWGDDLTSPERAIKQIEGLGMAEFKEIDIRTAMISGHNRLDLSNVDAAVLSCSDSRILPGQIFEGNRIAVVSNAGNIISPVALEYFIWMAKEGGVPIIVVLGHSGCGAVAAAMKGNEEDALFEIMRIIRSNISVAKKGTEGMINALSGAIMLKGNDFGRLPDGMAEFRNEATARGIHAMAMFFDMASGKAGEIDL